MTRYSHIAIGSLSAYVLGLPVLPAIIGSVAPDIDTLYSKGNGLLMSHRGITHHLVLGIFLLLSSFLTQNPVLMSFAVGFFSHIWADSLTIKGIPYWSNKDRISFKLFSTGSPIEYMFVASLFITVFFVFVFKRSFYIPADFDLIRTVILTALY